MLQGRRGEQEREREKKSRSVKVEGVLGSLLFSNTFFYYIIWSFSLHFFPLSLIAPSAVAAEAAAAYILMK